MTLSLSMAHCTRNENDVVGRPSKDPMQIDPLPLSSLSCKITCTSTLGSYLTISFNIHCNDFE